MRARTQLEEVCQGDEIGDREQGRVRRLQLGKDRPGAGRSGRSGRRQADRDRRRSRGVARPSRWRHRPPGSACRSKGGRGGRSAHGPPKRRHRPQSTAFDKGCVERVRGTILEECWKPAFARCPVPGRTGLRRELNRYLRLLQPRPYRQMEPRQDSRGGHRQGQNLRLRSSRMLSPYL